MSSNAQGAEDQSLALARRLQSQEEKNSGQAQVRKADSSKKDQLIGGVNYRPMEGVQPRPTRRRTDQKVWMFPPPEKINFPGTFGEARTACKERMRWLLVNIQSVQEFSSHQLNRDTWCDEIIQSLLNPEQGEFIFWQATNTEEEGAKYIQNYHINEIADLPHVAIIDPRTGEMVQKWKGFRDAQELATDICSFCSSRSLHGGARPDRAYSANEKDATTTDTAMQDAKPPSGMSEEEAALAAAIAMSMQESQEESTSDSAEPPAPPGQSVSPSASPASAAKPEATDSGDAGSVVGFSSKYPLSPEPDAGAEGSTRIQVRLATGKSVVRRFLITDLVGALNTLVQEEVAEAQTRVFDLSMTFPRKSLSAMLDLSIQEAGLANAAVMMKWV
jgi:hypothetical protein